MGINGLIAGMYAIGFLLFLFLVFGIPELIGEIRKYFRRKRINKMIEKKPQPVTPSLEKD
jgi:hypothetical protein